jgi:hypothetical protein
MPFHRGMSSSVALPPAVATGAVEQFNQDRASFVCYASANNYLTTVSFQYNTTNNWSSFSTVSAGTTVGQNQMMYFNITGLSVGTTYYVRAVLSSQIGTTIGGVVSFTTWSLKTYIKTTAGAFSVSIPSITPIGNSTLAPAIYEMLLYGAGGGANYGGGGGGGYRLAASHTSSTTGTQTVSGTVGSGGAAGNGGGGTGTATAGGSTTLTVGSTTWTGGGGGAGQHPGACSAPSGRGGTVGTGTNGANLGGTNTYGYYYFTGNYVQVVVGYNQYCCGGFDKYGNCLGYCPDYNSPIYGPDYNQPIYAWDCGRYAGGGGGGTDAAGGNAATQGSATHVGGNGGTGGGAYGLRGGNGGGGQGTQGNGSAGGFSVGSGTIVGSGGSVFSAGTAGGITFKYYGP